jgi:uncharacterized damage-inducible protein DinB
MKNQEIQNIKKLLDETFNGPAWHGPAVQEVLKDISNESALKSIGSAHNIAELVFHMIAWRNFLINKLKGQENYDVSEEENFQQIKTLTNQEWSDLKSRLQVSQDELQSLLSKQNDEILSQKVGKRTYTFYTLMHGIIQHDLYHLGQIILTKQYV